jgi:hypothetical protein
MTVFNVVSFSEQGVYTVVRLFSLVFPSVFVRLRLSLILGFLSAYPRLSCGDVDTAAVHGGNDGNSAWLQRMAAGTELGHAGGAQVAICVGKQPPIGNIAVHLSVAKWLQSVLLATAHDLDPSHRTCRNILLINDPVSFVRVQKVNESGKCGIRLKQGTSQRSGMTLFGVCQLCGGCLVGQHASDGLQVDALGSLVARFLFQPIEETFRTYFAGQLGSGGADADTAKSSRMNAMETLQTLLKFVLLVGLVAACDMISIITFSVSSALLHLCDGSLFPGKRVLL